MLAWAFWILKVPTSTCKQVAFYKKRAKAEVYASALNIVNIVVVYSPSMS